MKATELLQRQHREIEQLLERLRSNAQGDDRATREELAKMLVAHTKIEQEMFYPAVQEAAPELILEAIEEHGLADYELARYLTAKQDDAQTAKVSVLAEVVLLHIRREEGEIFRTAERALGGETLANLGAQMEPRYRELVTAGYVRLLDRALAESAPHLVRRAPAKKRARRAPAKKTTTKRRATPSRRTAVATPRRGKAGTAGARKGKKIAASRAGSRARSRARIARTVG